MALSVGYFMSSKQIKTTTIITIKLRDLRKPLLKGRVEIHISTKFFKEEI